MGRNLDVIFWLVIAVALCVFDLAHVYRYMKNPGKLIGPLDGGNFNEKHGTGRAPDQDRK